MAEAHLTAPRPKRRGRTIGIILGALLLFLVALYFIATSSAFFKGFILPRVETALNASLDVESADISPFSSATLKGVKMETTGAEPLLTAQEMRVRYSLMDILGGTMTIHEATLISPVINVVQNADGTSNLDPLLEETEETSDDSGSKESEQTKVNAQNISIQNGTVRLTAEGATRTELSNLNFSLDRFANGQSGKMKITSEVKATVAADNASATNGSGNFQGTLNGDIDFAVGPDLLPQSAKGQVKMETRSAEGQFSNLAQMNTVLDVDVTPQEIRQLAVRFNRSNTALGQLRVHGPFDANTQNGKLNVELVSIDRNVLEFLTAGKGMGFGSSTLNSTNVLTLAEGGNRITADGALIGRALTVEQDQQKIPNLDLDVTYLVNVDLNASAAVIQRLNLAGRQQGRDLLSSSLSSPMTISWGQVSNTVPDSALVVVLTNLNLADWKAVLPTNAPSGRVGGRVNLATENNGQLLRTDLQVAINDLSMALSETSRIANASVSLTATGAVQKLNIVQLDSFAFNMRQQQEELARGTGKLRYDIASNVINAELQMDAAVAPALAQFPVADLSAQSGRVQINATVQETAGQRKITGQMNLNEFTGRFADYAFDRYTARTDFDLSMRDQVVEISKVIVTLLRGTDPGGSIALSGRANLETQAASLTYSASNLNEHALGPFLKPSLGTNSLVSVQLTTTGKADYDPNGSGAVQANLRLADFIVGHGGTNRTGPLEARVTLDAGLAKEILDLRNFAIELTPTRRARSNGLQVKGKVGLNPTNAPPGTLSISSAAFDVTPYYNLLAGNTNVATTVTNAPATVPPTTDARPASLEPEPIELPVRDLAVDVKIDRFFLRDLEITNWVGSIAIRTNTIAIDPFKLSLNGAPVTARVNLDLGIPGYRYDVAFNAAPTPLDPVATTFLDSRPGEYSGTMLADINIKGAGTSGASLQKSLQGNVDVTLTNLNLQIVNLEQNAKLQRWVTLTEMILKQVGVLLQIPELIETPVNLVRIDMDMGSGEIRIPSIKMVSAAFAADAKGTIPIQSVLTNSPLDIPIELALSRPLAEKSRIANIMDQLVPTQEGTNSAYVKLPNFVRVAGTIGEPKPSIDEKRLLKDAAVGAATQLLKGGNIEENFKNLLGRKPEAGATNAPAATNAPSGTDALIRGLGGLLNRNAGAQTNPPAGTKAGTNAPPQTNRTVNPFDLLRGLQN